MKHQNRLAAPSHVVTSSIHLNSFIHEHLTQDDILTLQKQFLSNGFQYIKVKTINAGRMLIKRFLPFTMYHDIATVTTEDFPFDTTITHIYHELLIGGYLNPFEENFLEEFFIEEFYFDFMWIEATKKLINSSWYQHFENKLITFKLDQHIPMIVFMYDKE